MELEAFNRLEPGSMRQTLLDCCHCQRWSVVVAQQAPFATVEELLSVSHSAWQQADEAEILEAFSGHPRIGDLSALRDKYAATATAEQGQVAAADERVLQTLKDLNDEYFERFGFIFIVCATGKSAQEMLSLLQARIGNSRDQELSNGAREQAAIMQLRINKLFEAA